MRCPASRSGTVETGLFYRVRRDCQGIVNSLGVGGHVNAHDLPVGIVHAQDAATHVFALRLVHQRPEPLVRRFPALVTAHFQGLVHFVPEQDGEPALIVGAVDPSKVSVETAMVVFFVHVDFHDDFSFFRSVAESCVAEPQVPE